jgi:hypothetical protein
LLKNRVKNLAKRLIRSMQRIEKVYVVHCKKEIEVQLKKLYVKLIKIEFAIDYWQIAGYIQK